MNITPEQTEKLKLLEQYARQLTSICDKCRQPTKLILQVNTTTTNDISTDETVMSFSAAYICVLCKQIQNSKPDIDVISRLLTASANTLAQRIKDGEGIEFSVPTSEQEHSCTSGSTL